MSAPEDEWPSDDVLRIVYAFGDAGRKARVRLLAERVRANEDALRSARLQLEAAKMTARDARLATHRAEAAEAALRELSASAVQRVRDLERERDELEARVQELEAALREIVAIDSASPEHRIAMRALGDSPAVSTPRLRREQVEPTQTARLPAGCACGGEGWCDACQIRWR